MEVKGGVFVKKEGVARSTFSQHALPYAIRNVTLGCYRERIQIKRYDTLVLHGTISMISSSSGPRCEQNWVKQESTTRNKTDYHASICSFRPITFRRMRLVGVAE
jgi:hypothetical protein